MEADLRHPQPVQGLPTGLTGRARVAEPHECRSESARATIRATASPLEDLVRSLELAVLLLQLTDPLDLRSGHTRGVAIVDISACFTQVRTDSTP